MYSNTKLQLNLFASVLLLVSSLVPTLSAADHSAKITYISAAGIYLDAGRNAGVAVGDTCVVNRDFRDIPALLGNVCFR